MGAPASGSPGFIPRRPELRPLLRRAAGRGTGRVSPPASAPRPPAPSPLPLPSPQPRTAGRRPSAAPQLHASGGPGAGPGQASPSAGPPLPPKPQPQFWPACPLLCRKGNGHDWATKEQSTPSPAPRWRLGTTPRPGGRSSTGAELGGRGRGQLSGVAIHRPQGSSARLPLSPAHQPRPLRFSPETPGDVLSRDTRSSSSRCFFSLFPQQKRLPRTLTP